MPTTNAPAGVGSFALVAANPKMTVSANAGANPGPTPAQAINLERPFSGSSPWNIPTPDSTVWFTPPAPLPSTDWFINGGWIPYVAQASDPLWTFNMPNFIDLSRNVNMPAQSFQVRAPANIAPSTDSDGQLEVIQPDGSYVDVWRASVDSVNRIVTSTGPGWARGNIITGTGCGGLVSQGGNTAGTRAANFAISGGRISLANINGTAVLDHALVVSLPSSLMFNGGTTFVAPATAGDSFGAGTIKMGSRIGIPHGTSMPGGLLPITQQIFNALQTYGAFVGDFVGGGVPILQSDQPNGWWLSDLHLLSPLLKVADYQP